MVVGHVDENELIATALTVLFEMPPGRAPSALVIGRDSIWLCETLRALGWAAMGTLNGKAQIDVSLAHFYRSLDMDSQQFTLSSPFSPTPTPTAGASSASGHAFGFNLVSVMEINMLFADRHAPFVRFLTENNPQFVAVCTDRVNLTIKAAVALFAQNAYSLHVPRSVRLRHELSQASGVHNQEALWRLAAYSLVFAQTDGIHTSPYHSLASFPHDRVCFKKILIGN